MSLRDISKKLNEIIHTLITKSSGFGALLGMFAGCLIGLMFQNMGEKGFMIFAILAILGAIVGNIAEVWFVMREEERIKTRIEEIEESVKLEMPKEVVERARLKFPEIVTELPKVFASYNPEKKTLTINLKDPEAVIQLLTFGLHVEPEKIIFDFGDERIEMLPEEWREFFVWFLKRNIKKWRENVHG